jgi:D-alanyl-D-alanine carboxypeptidase
MRLRLTTLIAILALALAAAPAALAGGGGSLSPPGGSTSPAGRTLVRSMAAGMRRAGDYSGADVVDLTTGTTLYSHNASTPRLPASVQKLYTTTAALARYGSSARLTTSLLGTGGRQGSTYTGTLYLRGGGDPTFGSAASTRSPADWSPTAPGLTPIRARPPPATSRRSTSKASWQDSTTTAAGPTPTAPSTTTTRRWKPACGCERRCAPTGSLCVAACR